MKKINVRFGDITKWLIKNKEIAISIILGVIVLFLFFSSGFNSTKEVKSVSESEVLTNESSTYNITSTQYVDYLESKIEKALLNINGINKVSAIVMVDSSPRINVYEELDGANSITDNDTKSVKRAVIIKNGNIETPIILYEEFPKITGVLVIYNGESNANIKLNIVRAMQTLFNIDANKVEVLEG